ncbi:AsmA family protein [Serratia microhaemolytica]|uniref:AsmA family protein n=1 Tax=Serratia microhaemolytica TaxID=2675110 RepID=UPI000FDE173F|nr:AsmA family protein [Serratia microhaemolytica]
MKLIGKLLLTLLLLMLLAVVLCYFLAQTYWAAPWLSRWISQHSPYQLTVEKFSHSWQQPDQITLLGVQLVSDNQLPMVTAAQIDLVVSPRQLKQPLSFSKITLHNGSVAWDNVTANAASLRADLLQLNHMTLQASGDHGQLLAQDVDAGIHPWQPAQNLASNSQFQFSAASLQLNGVSLGQVLVQGEMQPDQQLLLHNFGANIARGELTGVAKRNADGHWQVERLRLSHVRWQTPSSLNALRQQLAALPPITLKRFDLIEAQLQGDGWAANNFDLTLKNITLQQGDWLSSEGAVSFSAGDMVSGDIHLVDPIATLQLTGQAITIKQFTTRWAGGLLRASGAWSPTDRRLQLDELVLAGVEYRLPTNWRALWLQPLPDWLAEVQIGKLNASNNLLMDTDPTFPFQLTALEGDADDLLLVRDHRWGIWSGALRLNASDATLNKVELRRPSLALTADAEKIQVTEWSAFTPNGRQSDAENSAHQPYGMLDATAQVGQGIGKPFTLALAGRAVGLQLLEQWGWQSIPLSGTGSLQLKLSGELNGERGFKAALQGQLQAVNQQGQKLEQRLP